MNTQNVRTAAPESSERWVKSISRILNEAHYEVACAEEACAHYGQRFTRLDAWSYFIRAVLTALFHKS